MRSRLLALVAILYMPSLHAQSLPSFFNSNDVEGRLPAPNLPADAYRPPAEATQLPDPDSAQPMFMSSQIEVRQVRIEGGSVYPFESLAQVYQLMVGKQVSLAELIDATRSITARYQQDGYPLSYAFLPTQGFDGGLVRVVLVEGYIADYKVRGELGPVQARIEALAELMRGERPLTRSTFERYSTLLGNLPGLVTRVQVPPPGTTDGATRMLIEAEKKTLQSSINLTASNEDSPQALFNVSSNSLTRFGEQVSLSALLPPGEDDERYYRLDYSQMLGSNGTQLSLSTSHYSSEPRDRLRLADGQELTQSRENDRYSLAVTHPLLAAQNRLWTLGARFYAVDDDLHYRLQGSAARIRSRTRSRALGVESEWRAADSERLRIVSAGLYQGFDAFGARTDAPATELDFLRLRLSVVQSDNYSARLQGVLSGALYWSQDPLPESEQAIFGGQNFGRGYPSDQASGDKGWGLAYELSYRFSRDGEWIRLWQPYAVVDTAQAWFNRPQLPRSRLASAAVGLRFGDARYYNIALEAAKPFADKALDSHNRSPRYTLSFSYQL